MRLQQTVNSSPVANVGHTEPNPHLWRCVASDLWDCCVKPQICRSLTSTTLDLPSPAELVGTLEVLCSMLLSAHECSRPFLRGFVRNWVILLSPPYQWGFISSSLSSLLLPKTAVIFYPAALCCTGGPCVLTPWLASPQREHPKHD